MLFDELSFVFLFFILFFFTEKKIFLPCSKIGKQFVLFGENNFEYFMEVFFAVSNVISTFVFFIEVFCIFTKSFLPIYFFSDRCWVYFDLLLFSSIFVSDSFCIHGVYCSLQYCIQYFCLFCIKVDHVIFHFHN